MKKKEWNRFSRLVVKYSWTLVPLIVLAWFIQIGTAILLPQVINSLIPLKLQVLGLFTINIVGFGIPLCISLILALKIILIDKIKIGPAGLWTIALWAVLVVLSLYLPISNVYAGFAGTNVPITLLFNANLFYHIHKKNYKSLFSLSYVLGFLAAFSSDFVSTFGIVKVAGAVWGGAGLVDADFLIPIVMMLTVMFVRKWQIRQKERTLM
jgi:hypothetical protein